MCNARRATRRTRIPGWGENIASAKELAKSLGISSLTKAFNFPVGTMFWMRSEALESLVELNLQWSDYPDEPLPDDGTMLHALERLIGAIPTKNGWKTMVTYTRGVNREA
jgi:lipopolysaccharide biosynthesis protein